NDWMLAAREIRSASIDSTNGRTEIDFTPNLRALRKTAQRNFIDATFGAVQKFRLKNGGALPGEFSQLAPFLPSPFAPEIFARYDVVTETGRFAVAEKPVGAVDPDEPDQLAYFEFNTKTGSLATETAFESPLQRLVREGAQRYADANGGARAAKPEQLAPYLPQPMSPSQLAEVFSQLSFIPGAAPASTPRSRTPVFSSRAPSLFWLAAVWWKRALRPAIAGSWPANRPRPPNWNARFESRAKGSRSSTT
ncbi:MAG: hypothetical protein ABIR80_04610, partial [Opitutaceae bacterium]